MGNPRQTLQDLRVSRNRLAMNLAEKMRELRCATERSRGADEIWQLAIVKIAEAAADGRSSVLQHIGSTAGPATVEIAGLIRKLAEDEGFLTSLRVAPPGTSVEICW